MRRSFQVIEQRGPILAADNHLISSVAGPTLENPPMSALSSSSFGTSLSPAVDVVADGINKITIQPMARRHRPELAGSGRTQGRRGARYGTTKRLDLYV